MNGARNIEKILRRTRMKMLTMELASESIEVNRSLDSVAAVHNEEIGIEPSVRYQNLELVGKGAMSQVFRAFDTVLDRIIAIKFLDHTNVTSVKRFFREAEAQGRIDHQGICKVYETGFFQEKPYIAMQYIQGEVLSQAASRMSLREKVQVMEDVAEAINAAHQARVIHRDIKPGNILVRETDAQQWEVYVTDFGFARDMDFGGSTSTGILIGTPSYMSPEQIRNEKTRLHPRSDVFSLGATFYELLCSERPFDGKKSVEVALKVLNENPVPLHVKNPSVPKELEHIVIKCLSKDPMRRYESAKSLALDLSRFLEGAPNTRKQSHFMPAILKLFGRLRQKKKIGE